MPPQQLHPSDRLDIAQSYRLASILPTSAIVLLLAFSPESAEVHEACLVEIGVYAGRAEDGSRCECTRATFLQAFQVV